MPPGSQLHDGPLSAEAAADSIELSGSSLGSSIRGWGWGSASSPDPSDPDPGARSADQGGSSIPSVNQQQQQGGWVLPVQPWCGGAKLRPDATGGSGGEADTRACRDSNCGNGGVGWGCAADAEEGGYYESGLEVTYLDGESAGGPSSWQRIGGGGGGDNGGNGELVAPAIIVRRIAESPDRG